MNQEKEMTQIVNSVGEYLAPRVKVVEMKARRVVCQQSINGAAITSMENEEGGW